MPQKKTSKKSTGTTPGAQRLSRLKHEAAKKPERIDVAQNAPGVINDAGDQAPGTSPAAADQRAAVTACSIVGVGASAGGLDAFLHLLEGLPTDANLAIIFVQHLLADRKSELPHVLSSQTRWPVVEATQGITVEPRHIYVIPPNVTLEVADGRLQLTPRAPDHGHHHLPVDYLFPSLAQYAQEKAIGVVLSGTGSDGAMGVREIRAVGGVAIAQLPDTAQYDGMPRAAIATDGVDLILPPAQIGPELARLASLGFTRHISPERDGDPLSIEEEQLQRVFAILRAANQVDFKYYKTPTIRRRLARRLTLQKIQKVSDYIKFLEQNPAEVQLLYRDLLIHVTRFFREPESFETLKQTVFPQLLQDRRDDEVIRIWVPGCSTGEEPYSVAISLLEFIGDRANTLPIQLFATDLSDAAVEKARAGVYPDNITEDLSPQRLRRFFTRSDGGYQITKAVRDLCIFARQDLTRDPPFSKLDLIVCRNVLIYLNAQVQKKLMGIFHYALKRSGYLMLGVAETIGPHSDLFAIADKKHRVYSKISTHHAPAITFPVEYRVFPGEHERQMRAETRHPSSVQEANRVLMERFAPPGVVVDSHLQIIYFQGQTGKYLEPPTGDASLHLLKMARDGIQYALRTAIRDVRKTGRPARREGLQLRRNGNEIEVNLEVVPLGGPGEHRHLLIVFEDAPTGRNLASTREPPGSSRRSSRKAKTKRGDNNDDEARIAVLQQELAASRGYLQSIIQDLEAANEELQSANEEILSSNEKLQSTNEELDTAKEELQSTNEELHTVNDELHGRNEELTRMNNDLVNVLANVQIAIVLVASDLRIRRSTPNAEKMLNVLPGDVGRPIGHIRPNLDLPNLDQLITESIESITTVTRKVKDHEGHMYLLRVRPYKTADNRIDGAVLGLVEMDADSRQ